MRWSSKLILWAILAVLVYWYVTKTGVFTP